MELVVTWNTEPFDPRMDEYLDHLKFLDQIEDPNLPSREWRRDIPRVLYGLPD